MNNKIDLPKLPKISLPADSFQPQNYNYKNAIDNIMKDSDESIKQIQEFNKQKNEREVQNNENLTKLVDYNSEITEYNKQLVDLNKSILTKINSVSTSLDFILKSIKENTQITKEDGIEHNALLLELITIMESKDKNKMKEFLGGLTGNVAAGLTVEYLKYKLGVS